MEDFFLKDDIKILYLPKSWVVDMHHDFFVDFIQ